MNSLQKLLSRTVTLHNRRADMGKIYKKGSVIVKQHCIKQTDYTKEYDLLSNISHDNIIFPQKSYIKDKKFCVEYKYYNEGDLYNWIVSRDPKEVRDSFYWIAEQTANSLKHVHDLGLVHLDVKPENYLLSGKLITLIDFETTESFYESNPHSLATGFVKKGTYKYMAPEMIQNCDYSPLSDVYSLGLLYYLVICYRLPDRVEPDIRPVSRAYPEFADCLTQMLQQNHIYRPQIKEVLDIIKSCK